MKSIRPIITIIIFALILFGVFLVFKQFAGPKEKYTVNLSSQTVIKQIRSLNRLETSSFTIEKIIDVGTSGNTFKQFLYGDRILLIAHGTVIAGFDLGKVSEKDINVSNNTLKVTMPAPNIGRQIG